MTEKEQKKKEGGCSARAQRRVLGSDAVRDGTSMSTSAAPWASIVDSGPHTRLAHRHDLQRQVLGAELEVLRHSTRRSSDVNTVGPDLAFVWHPAKLEVERRPGPITGDRTLRCLGSQSLAISQPHTTMRPRNSSRHGVITSNRTAQLSPAPYPPKPSSQRHLRWCCLRGWRRCWRWFARSSARVRVMCGARALLFTTYVAA